MLLNKIKTKSFQKVCWSFVLIGLSSFLSFTPYAFSADEVSAEKNSTEASIKANSKVIGTAKETLSELKYYQQDNVTNQIPYFDNRFRIDAQLDEISLIFYRSSGSKPIILVRPDGSKIRIDNYPRERVEWFDDRTFDMIKIKKPMPGPWQAIGDIIPNSKIMVLSDVKIVVDPLPETVFSGETLKVTGRLFNGDKAIDTPLFREVVQLDVNFYSTNNSAYENFGADAMKIASFRDDGYDLDEHAGDDIFTGEFLLDFSPGEWQPVYIVKLPMATRELRQKPILLKHAPITLEVETSTHESTPHSLKVTINPDYVDPDSMVFQGKVTFPDKQVEPFSIMDETGLIREKEIHYTEPGVHRINLSAFGKTLEGREFRLVIPEISFNVEGRVNDFDHLGLPGEKGASKLTPEQQIAARKAKLEEEFALVQEEKRLAAEEKNKQMMIIIAAGNGIIVLIGILMFFVMRIKKAKKAKN